MTRLLYEEWFPQIVYNHHQAPGMYPERMFVPPYDDPMNPNIPPLVMRGINAVGTAMHTRFEEEGKSGIISLDTYSAWWNGGMRTDPVLPQHHRHSHRGRARLAIPSDLQNFRRPAGADCVVPEPVQRRDVALRGHGRLYEHGQHGIA